MDFDTFIIGKKMERRGEERGELAKKSNSYCLSNIEKKQLLLIKHTEKEVGEERRGLVVVE
jgi:hypothetical protein